MLADSALSAASTTTLPPGLVSRARKAVTTRKKTPSATREKEQPEQEDLPDELEDAAAATASISRGEMTELESVIRGNLERYPDALLLTQVGSFFEVS